MRDSLSWSGSRKTLTSYRWNLEGCLGFGGVKKRRVSQLEEGFSIGKGTEMYLCGDRKVKTDNRRYHVYK